MKSKIWIDINKDNQPVIKVKAELTEDVRDKLLVRFFDNLGEHSTALSVNFTNGLYIEDDCKSFEAEIYPVSETFVNDEVETKEKVDYEFLMKEARTKGFAEGVNFVNRKNHPNLFHDKIQSDRLVIQ